MLLIKLLHLKEKAIDIEREVDDMKMAEYMEDHIGETFEGIVSSITILVCLLNFQIRLKD